MGTLLWQCPCGCDVRLHFNDSPNRTPAEVTGYPCAGLPPALIRHRVQETACLMGSLVKVRMVLSADHQLRNLQAWPEVINVDTRMSFVVPPLSVDAYALSHNGIQSRYSGIVEHLKTYSHSQVQHSTKHVRMYFYWNPELNVWIIELFPFTVIW